MTAFVEVGGIRTGPDLLPIVVRSSLLHHHRGLRSDGHRRVGSWGNCVDVDGESRTDGATHRDHQPACRFDQCRGAGRGQRSGPALNGVVSSGVYRPCRVEPG